jgi:hypothetical protein
MRAITMHQPWASLFLTKAKIHETRGRKTKITGPLLIHAAKKPIAPPHETTRMLEAICVKRFGKNWRMELPLGCLIGSVEIIYCLPTEHFVAATKGTSDFHCGDWRPKRFAWGRSKKVKVFETPIPYKGQQGFFNVPDEILTSRLKG